MFFFNIYCLIWERERERKRFICCSTYLCIHWLILSCALTGDRTCNLGVLGWNSNQISYPARAKKKKKRYFNQCWTYELNVSVKSGWDDMMVHVHKDIGSWLWDRGCRQDEPAEVRSQGRKRAEVSYSPTFQLPLLKISFYWIYIWHLFSLKINSLFSLLYWVIQSLLEIINQMRMEKILWWHFSMFMCVGVCVVR